MFSTDYEVYRSWLENNTIVSDLTSTASLKELTLYLLLGRNYRIVTEDNTRAKLFLTYAWLIDLYERAIAEFGEDWPQQLLTRLLDKQRLSPDEKNLAFWLTGFPEKTAGNLDIKRADLQDFLVQTIDHCNSLFAQINLSRMRNQSWLLLMAGAATLNIRGSQKSTVGKALEKVFLRASLTLLGLEYNQEFWTEIPSDAEVVRETDAEVETRRGRIRIDMGLIAQGNPEVITDKVGRVGRNGIVIFDKIGTRARTAYQTASQTGVKLIQIRHNQPLLELWRHLNPIVTADLIEPPQDESHLRQLLNNLQNEIFEISPQ